MEEDSQRNDKFTLFMNDLFADVPKPKSDMKYLIVCGSTLSGIGKGSTMSSLGVLFKACGLRVTCIKIDPYLNLDAGTMSPYEHGEVFVLDDGGEVDLDLGNYERSLQLTFTKDHNITSGKVFANVLKEERKGEYLGKTVQMIPHVTDKIKEMIINASNYIVEKNDNKKADICLIELGGTVGDIESGIFFEAIRQFTDEIGQENFAILLISYVPEIRGEHKTKPTQFGIKELKSLGLFPKFIVCRSTIMIGEDIKRKIAFSSNIPERNVISCYDVDAIWDCPPLLASQNLHFKIMYELGLPFREYKIHRWLRLSEHIRKLTDATEIKIAVCGKYIIFTDTYYSVMKSLQDAAFSANRKLIIKWLDCTLLEKDDNEEKENFWKELESCSGILVPGGFGTRGVHGMIKVVEYARKNKIPYFGICLGMQVAVIEFCKNVLGIENANSAEFDENCTQVITTMNDVSYNTLGGTLRLGAKTSIIGDTNSLAYKIYGKKEVIERHRHRYEVNPLFIKQIEEKGFIFSGKDIDSERMTMAEIPSHPFFFCTQFHPEFKTNPFNPTPIFYSFILIASKQFDKFLTFVETRKVGISELIRDVEDENIESKNKKYDDMFKQILWNYKQYKLYSSDDKIINNVVKNKYSETDPVQFYEKVEIRTIDNKQLDYEIESNINFDILKNK